MPSHTDNLLELTGQFERPLTKYLLPEQAEEIDRRLHILLEYCQGRAVLMTKAHIYLVLGIDDNTLTRWLNMTTRASDADKGTDEEKRYIAERGAIIKKWLLYAESWGSELVSTNPKAAGPIFLMKSVYQYREYDDKQQVNVNIGIEAFLADNGKKEKQISTPTPDHLLRLVRTNDSR